MFRSIGRLLSGLRGSNIDSAEITLPFTHLSDSDFQMSEEKYLIVGLGNPGKKYSGNRHNIGFMAIDRYASRWGVSLDRVEQQATVAKTTVDGKPVILAKPKTFMNSSGDSVGPLANYYKIPAANVMVVYDEIDIAFGVMRIRPKGGAAGHNGMRSIIQHLGNEFPRIRLGVGRPDGKMPVHAYVLQDFHKDEKEIVDIMLSESAEAVETWLRDGIDLAMSHHNKSAK